MKSLSPILCGLVINSRAVSICFSGIVILCHLVELVSRRGCSATATSIIRGAYTTAVGCPAGAGASRRRSTRAAASRGRFPAAVAGGTGTATTGCIAASGRRTTGTVARITAGYSVTTRSSRTVGSSCRSLSRFLCCYCYLGSLVASLPAASATL